MGYRKFKSDLLFTGTDLLKNDAVLVMQDNGKVEEIVPAVEAGDDVEILSGLVTPGFVNTHCHTELSHMKGKIAPGTGLIPFLIKVIRERTFPQQLIDEAIDEAIKELYASGTVAVGDICNTTHSLAAKNKSNICWYNFIEVIGFTEKAEDRFAFASNTLREFEINRSQHYAEKEAPLFQNSLVPHAPYSVSMQLFSLINSASNEVVSIHNQETAAENEYYQSKTGKIPQLYEALKIDAGFFQPSAKTSLQTYMPWLDRASHLLLVHNSFSSAEDVLFAKQVAAQNRQHIFFSTCINANLYIESVIPPLLMLREHDCTICLGTDSYASNHSLNLLDEMKTIQEQFSTIPLDEILRWATLNGARALTMEDRLGSFESGKFPGVVHVSNMVNEKLTAASTSHRIL